MALSNYYIKLKDHSGAVVALFAGAGRAGGRGDLRALSYKKLLRYPGEWRLYIDGNDDRLPLFDYDYQVEFWRRDPVGGLAWYCDFEGFVRSLEFTQDEEGRDVFAAFGRGYNDLLTSEAVYSTSDSALARKAGPAESVCKEFVNEGIGPGAGADDLGLTRVRPGLTIEADAATGAVWQGTGFQKNLLDVCVTLAEYAPADYMIVGTGPATFEFQWRAGQWGQDKTSGNGVRPPVVFAAQLGNATTMHYLLSRLEEVNVVYGLGSGVGAVRLLASSADAGALAVSPWARRAVTRQMSNGAQDLADCQLLGQRFLAEQRARAQLTFVARQTAATRYGRDWDWGDLVTALYTKTGLQADFKIVGVAVAVNAAGEETITPEVEDA